MKSVGIIKVGQVLFTAGYSTENESRRAIYEIGGNDGFPVYKSVFLDGRGFNLESRFTRIEDRVGQTISIEG